MIDKVYNPSDMAKVNARLRKMKLDNEIAINAGESRRDLIAKIINQVNHKHGIESMDKLLKPRYE